jgi:hypothetical protein
MMRRLKIRPKWGLRSSERVAKGKQWKLRMEKPGLVGNPDGVVSEIIVVMIWPQPKVMAELKMGCCLPVFNG